MDDIFISYRRDDSDATVGRINDRLKGRFGEEHVFRDKSSIQYGRAFPKRIQEALGHAVVMLVVIGPEWLTVRHKDGRRRLELPDDWVRKEVATALRRGILVIPTLVQGAASPEKSALSRDLAGLVDLHAIHVRGDPDFDDDMERLIMAIMATSPALASVTREPLQVDQDDIDEDGEDPDELVSAGWSLVQDGHRAQAVRLFHQALRRDSRNAKAWEGLGDAYLDDDHLEDALDAYSRSLALAPENTDAWLFTAQVLIKLGRHQDALAAYDRALTIDPTDMELWGEKADVLRGLGREDEAEEAERQVDALEHRADAEFAALAYNTDDVETLINQADVLLSLDAPERALDVCERAVALHPGDARVWELMARILRVLGRTAEAVDAERKARARGG